MIFILCLIYISINKIYNSCLIMQQQYYSIKRYLKVIFKDKGLIDYLFLLISSFAFYFNSVLFRILFLIATLFLYFPKKEKRIIKLKFTKRIIRTYIVSFLFIILISIFINLLSVEYRFLLVGLFPITFYYLYLIPFIIENIYESILRRYYFNKAKKKLKKFNSKIIVFVGSFGKTSSKNYLYQIMRSYYKVLKTPKSYNTLLGLVSFINNDVNETYDYLLLEVGVDCVNGMNKFLKLFTPDIVIVTGFAPQHLATFKTIENIVNEKMKMACIAKEKVFINGEFKDLIKEDFGFIYYYENELEYININSFKYNNHMYETKLFGKHLWVNLLSSIKVSEYINIPSYLIKKEVKNITNTEHRFQLKKEDNYLIIDDSYNSNLYSFCKALDSLNDINKYKIIITPGLIELGNKAKEYNEIIARKCLDICDKIILVGNNKYFAEKLKSSEKFSTFLSFKEAFDFAKSIDKDKVILIENDLPDVFIE